MPLVATLVLNFSLGVLVSLAAAQELRASPRPVHRLRAFRALALHQGLIAMPVALYLFLRHGDWMVSYVLDSARVPSVLVAAVVLFHGGIALAGLTVGAYLLRDHRVRAVYVTVAIGIVLVVLTAVLFRERLSVMGTYVQFRGGFSLQPLWRSRGFTGMVALGGIWTLAAVHLLWSLHRKT